MSQNSLKLLYKIGQISNEEPINKTSLNQILRTISENLNIKTLFINTFIENFTQEISYSANKKKYSVGTNLMQKVFEEGEAILIDNIAKKKVFPSCNDEDKIIFFCIPLVSSKKKIGTLSGYKDFDINSDFKQLSETLFVVASIISRFVLSFKNFEARQKKLFKENKTLKDALKTKFNFSNIVGKSNKMREVFQMISQVAGSSATVLIRGESGTGKELVASSIHYNSLRTKNPFVRINCASLPESLIESEFFGHEKGAFTSAISQKKGKFELANKGTIFLDEIGSINLNIQAKLLRVLQEKEIVRVGGNKTIKVDVRIIAATNKNLEEAIKQGSFREDLYYRLNVFPIYLPKLSERKTDILLLADYFLGKYGKENKKNINRFSSSAIDAFMLYHWPGNVRELENCIERATIVCEGNVIHSYHLPPTIRIEKVDNKEGKSKKTFSKAVLFLEKEMIIDALHNTKGKINLAADMLGLTKRKMAYRLKRHGINYKDFRLK